MKKTNIYLLLAILLFGLQACDEDKVKDVSKKGSIETSIQVDHLTDSLDVMITTNRVWVRNSLVKTVIHTDTVPSLGFTREDAENENGDTKSVYIKKDYELYITIK